VVGCIDGKCPDLPIKHCPEGRVCIIEPMRCPSPFNCKFVPEDCD